MTVREINKEYPNWKNLTNWRPSYVDNKTTYYKSLKTGKEYLLGNRDRSGYCNHGHGGDKKFAGNTIMDLPKEEYPYTMVHDIDIPKWVEGTLKSE